MFMLLGAAPMCEPAQGALSRAVDFDSEVRPVLAARCYRCHGPDPSSRKAGLRLDAFEHATATLPSGKKAIVPSHPEESALLRRVTHSDISERMPPEGHDALTAAEIATLERWIAGGAAYTAPWAFTPLAHAAVPVVQDQAWPRGDLDRFVLGKLESRGLEPAADAEPEVLLRRVAFDLTGLPPAPELRERYLANPTEASLALIVDELLASGAFGERWARHWLDCVRYSETLGHEFDYAIPSAWRYRDWVIDAFNRDLPVERFVTEQVAGDAAQPRAVAGIANNVAPIATTFWWMGQATHAPTDVRQDEADRHANSIEVFGKAFLGLTVSCARCHDHKFDPIPTTDFYSLLGVLRSTQRVVGFSESDATLTVAVEQTRDALNGLLHGVQSGAVKPASEAAEFFEDFAPGFSNRWSSVGWAFARPQPVVRADGALDADLLDSARLHARLQGALFSKPFEIQKKFMYARLRGNTGSFRVVVDNYWLDDSNALLFESCRHIPTPEWRTVKIDLSRFVGERAYIEILDDSDGVIEVDWIACGDGEAPTDDVSPRMDGSISAEAASSNREIRTSFEAALALAPSIGRTLEARDAAIGFDESVHIRGKAAQYGEGTSRAALSFVSSNAIGQVKQGSGRRELAAAIVDPSTPFVWRTLANRIVHYLLGRGIVRTTDDFGQLGRPPTHPELLDALALRLQSHGSMKTLVREIVLSRTYRQSSEASVDASRVDPDNDLFSRATIRRLDGEAIRDAMLVAAGSLDTRMHGPSVPVYLDEFMTGRGRPGASGPLDGANRRSIYLEVRRNFLDPFMQVFDAPVPTTTVGCRNRSNVPAQSLAMLNDPLVHELANRFAARVMTSAAPTESLINDAFIAAYGRAATDDDVEDATAFLLAAAPTAQERGAAWVALCHVLFNAKEFTHLR